jgi:hypothetical protein
VPAEPLTPREAHLVRILTGMLVRPYLRRCTAAGIPWPLFYGALCEIRAGGGLLLPDALALAWRRARSGNAS